MKTRLLETKFWKDTYIVGLTIEQRLLYIYFITNERVNIIHCYEITDREIQFDTGIDRGIITPSKTRFQKDGKFSFYKDYVFLLNACKYESYVGEKNDNAKLKLYKQMPPDVLDWYRGIYTPLIGTISQYQYQNHKSEIINQKSKAEIASIESWDKFTKTAHAIIGRRI